MPIDPFRIQFLTVTLDSHVVLAIVGIALGGLTFRAAASRAGFTHFGAGTWWDVITAAVIGGRAVWVATHLEYYVRAPLQALVVIDGGLSAVGLVLGAAYAVGRLARGGDRGAWRGILEFVALGTLVTFAFERAGCALTTCGGGPPTDVAWALLRGDELRQPIALYQAAIVIVALLLATELRRMLGQALPLVLVALGLVQVAALAWGGHGPDLDSLAALVLAVTLPTAAWLISSTPRANARAATMHQ